MTSDGTKAARAAKPFKMRAGRDTRTPRERRITGLVLMALGGSGLALVVWLIVVAYRTVHAIVVALGSVSHGHGASGLIGVGVLAALLTDRITSSPAWRATHGRRRRRRW